MSQVALLDLDGVCYDIVGAVCRFLQDRWLLDVTPAMVTDYKLTKLAEHAAPGRQAEVAREIAALFGDPRFYHDLKLLPGVQEAVSLLSRRYNLWVLTGRPIENGIAKETRFRVAKDFPALVAKSPCGELEAKVRCCRPDRKPLVAKEMRAVRVFEDNPTTAVRIAAKRINVTLLRTPYMGTVRPYRIHFAASLLEAARELVERPDPLDALLSSTLGGAMAAL